MSVFTRLANMNHFNFEQLFINDTPLMDVRAPVEHLQGSFPNSQNIPLLDDEQRRIIGTEYKNNGQDSAIALGWTLASEEVIQQRLQHWQQFVEQHPDGYLFCFRGGLRSKLSQQLLAEAKFDYPIIPGGYKAMRRYLIEQLEHASGSSPFVIIAGPTGSGKTEVVKKLNRAIDLEGRAQHRGSAFGATGTEQPSQINFENLISIDWLKLEHQKAGGTVFLEDEGHLIGRITLPTKLQASMKQSPLVVVEEPLERRVEWVVEDYVNSSLKQDPEIIEQFSKRLNNNLQRISRRLGGERYQHLQNVFEQASELYREQQSLEGYRQGIEVLLRDYYDPMYKYQLSQRKGEVLFRGSRADTIDWCNHLSN